MSKTFNLPSGNCSPAMPLPTRIEPDLWNHNGITAYARALFDAVKGEFPDHVVTYPLPPFLMFPAFTLVDGEAAYWNEDAMLEYGKRFVDVFMRAIKEHLEPQTEATFTVGQGLSLTDGMEVEAVPDWATLGKRLIGAMHYGIRIEQESGHRWIAYNRDADNWPRRAFENEPNYTKEYGSYTMALDFIDAELAKHGYDSLLEVFDGINHFEDLGVVFGEGVQ